MKITRAAARVCSPSRRVSIAKRRAVYSPWTSRKLPAHWCRRTVTSPASPTTRRAVAATSRTRHAIAQMLARPRMLEAGPRRNASLSHASSRAAVSSEGNVTTMRPPGRSTRNISLKARLAHLRGHVLEHLQREHHVERRVPNGSASAAPPRGRVGAYRRSAVRSKAGSTPVTRCCRNSVIPADPDPTSRISRSGRYRSARSPITVSYRSAGSSDDSVIRKRVGGVDTTATCYDKRDARSARLRGDPELQRSCPARVPSADGAGAATVPVRCRRGGQRIVRRLAGARRSAWPQVRLVGLERNIGVTAALNAWSGRQVTPSTSPYSTTMSNSSEMAREPGSDLGHPSARRGGRREAASPRCARRDRPRRRRGALVRRVLRPRSGRT